MLGIGNIFCPSVPDLVVIAGPNGARKSTSEPRRIGCKLGIVEFVNADVIAAGLSAHAPESVAIEAGRIMLKRLDELADARSLHKALGVPIVIWRDGKVVEVPPEEIVV